MLLLEVAQDRAELKVTVVGFLARANTSAAAPSRRRLGLVFSFLVSAARGAAEATAFSSALVSAGPHMIREKSARPRTGPNFPPYEAP
ncbi:hypothetical protein BKD09_41245 [Bradyrhizobium japonicum]|uniref:Uncharacterized protein n=3 Tax=Bradyrhizobium TaxID=374 RepID=A0A837CDY8_9BRAD|nr:hypothetical protein BJS_07645 [Bradyrhizobium japonicum SEMIA 5079]APG14797.1 hypothetical protein BKD09_41245 [Bradyrhizobium japonicum]AWL91366.1 hypothetical protein CIT37_02955 [Bradyrhizobium ottawaense]KGJ67516.1 hypothetical protein BJA5080_07631 [Bradyrhizobium diazoefficiens SEMIA 5080]MYV87085.1 hypothetical protein [Bradyrhizobium japonicum]